MIKAIQSFTLSPRGLQYKMKIKISIFEQTGCNYREHINI